VAYISIREIFHERTVKASFIAADRQKSSRRWMVLRITSANNQAIMKILCLLVLGGGLLVFSGCGSSSDVKVISAVYGTGTNFVEVTAIVNKFLVQKPSNKFFANPKWLQADPTPGWNKALVIVYEFKNQRHVFTAGEGDAVTAQGLRDAARQ
jgi:hypothetical protein